METSDQELWRRAVEGEAECFGPAAALAVAAAVGGAAVITDSWGDSLAVADPAAQADGGLGGAEGCGYARRASPAAGDGLRYLRSAPTGWTYTSWLTQIRYCSRGRLDADPVVSFVRQAANGTVTAALTIWRALPPNRGADPEGVATETAAPVPTGNVTFTWAAPDGRRWSITGAGFTVEQLTEIAGDLVLDGETVSWPNASAQNFDRLSIPPQQKSKERSWQPEWHVCYATKNLGQCTLSVDVDRTRIPWQAWISQLSLTRPVRLVEVNGRPGVLTDNGRASAGILRTSTADGAQLGLMGSVPASSSLVEFAQQLKQVAAADPLIREPAPTKGQNHRP